MDNKEFEVRYITIQDKDARTHRIIKAKKVHFTWYGDVINLIDWEKLEKEEPIEWFNPDKPRNLAKSVTVN